jgi:hypothetical protein
MTRRVAGELSLKATPKYDLVTPSAHNPEVWRDWSFSWHPSEWRFSLGGLLPTSLRSLVMREEHYG